jgi:hypothetical protein
VIYRGKPATVSSVDDDGFEGRTNYEVRYKDGIEGGIEDHELSPAPLTALVELRVADLAGPLLAYAVAVAEGSAETVEWCCRHDGSGKFGNIWTDDWGCYRPDIDWDIGGPLIAKHAIGFVGKDADNWLAFAAPADEEQQGVGPTHLIAACRLIVRAALGEVVSVPVELVQAVQS